MLRIVLILCLAVLSAAVSAQERHAFVVGIDRYEEVPALQKAGNDAEAVAAALTTAGFAVDLVRDADRRTLFDRFAAFAARLQVGDEAVFFFAGHGIEVQGLNYLLAADVPALRPGDELMLESEGMNVDRVLSMIQARGVRAAILIIDACRDNPFPTEGTRSIGGTRGLSPIEPPAGAMVLFSAGAGQQALDRLSEDDDNPNSVFTRLLLPLLVEPGLPLHEAARRLKSDVEDLAATIRHIQRPAIYDEMRGDFMFVPASEVQEDPGPEPQTPLPLLAADPCVSARADWDRINSVTGPVTGALTAFVETYANCPTMAGLARDRLAAIELAAATAEDPEPAADTRSVAARECRGLTDPDLVGFAELEQSDLAATIRTCQTATLAFPDDMQLRAYLGRAHLAAGQYPEALRQSRTAADAGDTLGMNTLGTMYGEGLGVPRNDADAVLWFRAAAEAGDGRGMNNLGVMYSNGLGVPRDDAEALRLYRAAAEAGVADGMINLGWVHDNGRGLAQDSQAAAAWYLAGHRAGSDWLVQNIRGLRRETVAEIQRNLARKALYSGAADGTVGTDTLAALARHTDQGE